MGELFSHALKMSAPLVFNECAISVPWVGHGRAMGEGTQVMKSELCPQSVHVQGLSRVGWSLSYHPSLRQTI